MKLRRFFVAAVLLLSMGSLMAQQMPLIPVDPDVRVGKLSNGLTYYIRHNEYPKNVVNFYIAQRVGSINENDSQRGLAHFLEHMAFNGSEHFKGNGIIDFTRTLGVEFGSDLNAYTSIDQTVYRVCDVPTTRVTALDSCLLILKDWSNGLTLDTKEIDKERGVIHQEWQMRSDASMRFLEKYLPILYPGSKYGYRLPIGLMSIVDHFKPKELRDYYHKWYRPDNQAIIVVGNIDVNHVESEIKKLWAGVTVPANAAKVIDEPVPDNNTPIYVTDKDKEQQYSEISVFMKRNPTPDSLKNSMMYLVRNYVKNMMFYMLNSRFSELTQNDSCPFIQANTGDGEYLISKTKDAFQAVVVPKEDKDMAALKSMMVELQRARDYGFTATEYARAKSELLSDIEKMYTNKDKTDNTYFYSQYVANYLNKEPMPSIDTQYKLANAVIPRIPLEAVNEMAKELISKSDTNLVVIEQAQEKEGKTYVTVDEMKQAVAAARNTKSAAWVDHVKQEPLIAKMPVKGKIVKETENKKLGFKTLYLSNGAKVILKKTDFKDAEVLMQATAKGGSNLFAANDYANLKVFDDAIGYSGIGDFSSSELQKELAGKNANANLTLGSYHTTVTGNSTPKDLETMMQMTYLYFTNIKKDERSYHSLMDNMEISLKNKDLRPESVFSDSLRLDRYAHNPRFASLNVADLSKVNYDRILAMAKQLTADASKFTFYFSGNFDETKLREYIEQYIASLPADTKAKVNPGKEILTLTMGNYKDHFSRKMETPKAQLYAFWTSKLSKDNLSDEITVDAAGQVLDMALLRSIREDNSAAYSVGAQGFSQNTLDNKAYYVLFAGCPMDPAKAKLAYDLMMKGVKDASEKVDPADVQKVKEFMLKQADEDARKNNHWLNVLYQYNEYGQDVQTNYKTLVNALTPEKISNFIKKVILSSGNKVEVLMTPVK
nr:M16 family metallopeptidase [uncultured Prevotella sp.]